MKISKIIAEKVLHTITADESVQQLVDALTTFQVGALVVSPDGKTIDGIVSERDVVKYHLEEISDENIALKQYVGRGNWVQQS